MKKKENKEKKEKKKKKASQWIICARCGNMAKVPKLKTRKYCSYDCYYESKCEREIENHHKDFEFDEFCKGCGNVIKKYGYHRRCSKECLEKIREKTAPRGSAQKMPELQDRDKNQEKIPLLFQRVRT